MRVKDGSNPSESRLLYKAHSEFFNDDFEYYRNFCNGFRTLELFAGYGRLANQLVRGGTDIEVVEIDPEFASFIRLPTNKKHVCNVLDFVAEKPFERVVAGYNSFCLLTKDDEISLFFKKLDSFLVHGGRTSLSYYDHRAWGEAAAYTFQFNGKEVQYIPSFDLSKLEQNIGVWIDQEKGDGIDSRVEYTTRIYQNQDSLLKFLGGTKLTLMDTIKNYNKTDILEPGWIEYVFEKK